MASPVIAHNNSNLMDSACACRRGGSEAAASTPYVAAPPASSACLWSIIAPFDHNHYFLRRHLWPLLNDRDAIAAMTINRATNATFNERDMYTAFHLPPPPLWPRHRTAMAVKNVLCPPRIVRLDECRWPCAREWLPRLPHLTSIDECIVDERQNDLGALFNALPATMHSLTLTLESGNLLTNAGPVVSPLPAYVRTVVVHDNGFSLPIAHGVLPAELEQLRLESCTSWNHSLAGVFPADSRLRELHIKGAFNQSLRSVLPSASLAVLNLTGSNFNHPLDELQLPNLTALSLGGRVAAGFDVSILAGSLRGLPSLRLLDLSSACAFNHEIPLGALSDSKHLTSLSLPQTYSQPLLPGVLPQSLRQLRLGGGDVELHVGCLPDELLSLVVGDCKDADCRFNQPLPAGLLPTSLTELYLVSRHFNQPLDTAFPVSNQLCKLYLHTPTFSHSLRPLQQLHQLRTLVLVKRWPEPIHGAEVLPPTLRHFALSGGYSHELTADTLAGCYQLLTLHLDTQPLYAVRPPRHLFCSHVAGSALPLSLTRLSLPETYPRGLLRDSPLRAGIRVSFEEVVVDDFRQYEDEGQHVDGGGCTSCAGVSRTRCAPHTCCRSHYMLCRCQVLMESCG